MGLVDEKGNFVSGRVKIPFQIYPGVKGIVQITDNDIADKGNIKGQFKGTDLIGLSNGFDSTLVKDVMFCHFVHGLVEFGIIGLGIGAGVHVANLVRRKTDFLLGREDHAFEPGPYPC